MGVAVAMVRPCDPWVLTRSRTAREYVTGNVSSDVTDIVSQMQFVTQWRIGELDDICVKISIFHTPCLSIAGHGIFSSQIDCAFAGTSPLSMHGAKPVLGKRLSTFSKPILQWLPPASVPHAAKIYYMQQVRCDMSVPNKELTSGFVAQLSVGAITGKPLQLMLPQPKNCALVAPEVREHALRDRLAAANHKENIPASSPVQLGAGAAQVQSFSKPLSTTCACSIHL